MPKFAPWRVGADCSMALSGTTNLSLHYWGLVWLSRHALGSRFQHGKGQPWTVTVETRYEGNGKVKKGHVVVSLSQATPWGLFLQSGLIWWDRAWRQNLIIYHVRSPCFIKLSQKRGRKQRLTYRSLHIPQLWGHMKFRLVHNHRVPQGCSRLSLIIINMYHYSCFLLLHVWIVLREQRLMWLVSHTVHQSTDKSSSENGSCPARSIPGWYPVMDVKASGIFLPVGSFSKAAQWTPD